MRPTVLDLDDPPAVGHYRIDPPSPPSEPKGPRWPAQWRRFRRRLGRAWGHFWFGRRHRPVSWCCNAILPRPTVRSHWAPTSSTTNYDCPTCRGRMRML